jgi:hypothetical protein
MPANRPVAGQFMNVYDPNLNLVDMTRPTRHKGKVIYPLFTQAETVRWSVKQGMGVYLRYYEVVADTPVPNVVDLTPYVKFEDADVQVEIGQPLRGLTNARR